MPNWIDTVFLVCLAVAVLKSFRAGTFRLLVEIVVFFLSIYVSEKICHVLMFDAKVIESSNTLAYAIFFAFFFAVAYALLKVLMWLLGKVVKVEILGTFDKVIAGAVGILVALLNAGLILNLALMFPFSPDARQYIEASQTHKIAVPVFNQMYESAFAFSPEVDRLVGKNIEDAVKQNIQKGQDAVEQGGAALEAGKKKATETLGENKTKIEETVKKIPPPPAKIL
ncbi:MAG: CvpA family protein [Candidatus Margulisiibacteriota bacterium]